jgi:lysozyme family protein
MASQNWPIAFAETLKHEGGFTNDRRDPGNWTGGKVGRGELRGTNLGIASHSFPHLDIRSLTPATVKPIYKTKYWDKVRGDDLPSGVDLVTYDAGVNSGPARGARWTQRAVGAKQDGVIGRLTLAALASVAAVVVVKKATDFRLAFLQGLSTWKVFGNGWGRRVGSIRAMGLNLAGQSVETIREDAKVVDKGGTNDNRGAAASGAGGGGAGVAGVDQAAAVDWGALAALGAVALVLIALAVFLSIRARQKHSAAEAMNEVADELEWGN